MALLRARYGGRETVKAAGNHLVHLEKLAEKDFYDALIRLDDISAIDARFR